MFYVMNNNKIVLADNDKQKIINTLPFLPEYSNAPILETDQEIENFMFVGSPEWLAWKSETETNNE